jgi:hypothetical protein
MSELNMNEDNFFSEISDGENHKYVLHSIHFFA